MNTPTITKNLIIINVLCFFATFVLGRYGLDLNDLFGLHFFIAQDFKLYQLFTYMFMHKDVWHIFVNMFAVWMFGRVMESSWGERRFLVYYLVCGIGAGLIQEVVQYISYLSQDLNMYSSVNIGHTIISMDDYLNLWTTVGASGAVYAILLAFGMTYPNNQMYIFPLPVPIKAKFIIIGYIVFELLSGLSGSGDNVAHFAHLGGMLFGFFLLRYWRNRGGGMYGTSSGNVKDRMNRWFSNVKKKFEAAKKPRMKVYMSDREQDYKYNMRRKEEQAEIDALLDKVRKSGYESLTAEEKRKLFDFSQK